MIIDIFYYNDNVEIMTIDSDDWIVKAPNTILRIEYMKQGVKHQIQGWGAYFIIDGYVGGFNTITGISLIDNTTKYIAPDDIISDERVKLGKEISNEEWRKFKK